MSNSWPAGDNDSMGLKGKLWSMVHSGLASLLLLIVLFLIVVLLSAPNAEIEQALQDMVFVSSPTFNCSELRLKGEKQVVVDGQHYHTFPSHANPGSICQSKFQQHCFRKNTGPEYFPPPKFLSLLRDYEAYHEMCTKGHNLTALGLSGDTPEGCKYLVWKSADGMGNQLLSLVCAFVYSLLTNRVMLIATDSHIDSYLCNPFPLSSWLLPKDFPEQQLRRGAKRVHTYLDETLATVQGNHSYNIIPPVHLPYFISQAPKHIYAFITCCDAKRDHQFFCPTAQKLFSGSNWFFYLSHEYTLPGFYFIPEFREKLNDWFPHQDVFMHASRYLLNPENELWARISQFYKAHMDGVDTQIGIQARSWRWDYNPSISRQILRCAVEQYLLPKTLETTDMGLKLHQRHPDISVLVASLRGEYRDNLALQYVNHPNVDGLDVDVISASSEGFQKTGNAAHDATAVIDIWLLSFAHDLITTPFSTFGSTASGLAGIVPLLFNNYGQDKVLEPACGRTNAGGPCFTTYPSNQPCDLDPPRSSIFDPDKMVPEEDLFLGSPSAKRLLLSLQRKQNMLLRPLPPTRFYGCLNSSLSFAYLSGLPTDSVILYCDNQSAIALAVSTTLFSKTKHICISYHFLTELKELVAHGFLFLAYVPTTSNWADFFTKAVPTDKHLASCRGLSLTP